MKVTDAVYYLEFFGSCEMVLRQQHYSDLLRRKPCFAASLLYRPPTARP
jgi:hypothetical protein